MNIYFPNYISWIVTSMVFQVKAIWSQSSFKSNRKCTPCHNLSDIPYSWWKKKLFYSFFTQFSKQSYFTLQDVDKIPLMRLIKLSILFEGNSIKKLFKFHVKRSQTNDWTGVQIRLYLFGTNPDYIESF